MHFIFLFMLSTVFCYTVEVKILMTCSSSFSCETAIDLRAAFFCLMFQSNINCLKSFLDGVFVLV